MSAMLLALTIPDGWMPLILLGVGGIIWLTKWIGNKEVPNTTLDAKLDAHRAESKANSLEAKEQLRDVGAKVEKILETQGQHGGSIALLDERTRGHGAEIDALRRRVSMGTMPAIDPTAERQTGRYPPVKK
jgi:hypothetical protein